MKCGEHVVEDTAISWTQEPCHHAVILPPLGYSVQEGQGRQSVLACYGCK